MLTRSEAIKKIVSLKADEIDFQPTAELAAEAFIKKLEALGITMSFAAEPVPVYPPEELQRAHRAVVQDTDYSYVRRDRRDELAAAVHSCAVYLEAQDKVMAQEYKRDMQKLNEIEHAATFHGNFGGYGGAIEQIRKILESK